MTFDGTTYDAALDWARLDTQLARVYHRMLPGSWMTLRELARDCGGSEAGISARCRDLRKPRWGAYIVERRRRGEASRGVWEYRLLVPVAEPMLF